MSEPPPHPEHQPPSPDASAQPAAEQHLDGPSAIQASEPMETEELPQPTQEPYRPTVLGQSDVIRGDQATLEPFYPASRLLKSAVLEADERLAMAQQAQEQAREEAEQMLERTREQAKDLMEQARQEADQIRQQAREKGGAEAAAEFGQILGNAQAEVQSLRSVFPREALNAAFQIAQVILDVEFRLKPERIVPLIADVLKQARSYDQLTVSLHPTDLPVVQKHLPELVANLRFAEQLKLVADESVARFGVRVETEMGYYNTTIESRLQRIRDQLLESPDAG
jgi:flagellar biosynthesis/type III secretory pathway protein FliH